MDIDTDYAVRLFFGNTSFVQVYFEAVANAIDAHADRISVKILSNGELARPSIDIEISDNGVGFTQENFDRFARLVAPKDEYHKGLGRLVYLNYFRRVDVVSVYGSTMRRFVFSRQFAGESETGEAQSGAVPGTTVRFRDFHGARLHSYNDLKPGALKARLIEQFFPLLHERKLTGRPIRISLELDTSKESAQHDFVSDRQVIDLTDIPDLQRKVFQEITLDAFASITMWYSVQGDVARRLQFTAASVDGRTIPLKLFPPKALPPDCAAVFFFESDLFTGRSDSARQRLELPDEVSEPALLRTLREQVSAVLSAEVPEIERRNQAMREDFEARYPHLIGLFETDTVGLIDRDEAISLAQNRFFRKQRDLLEGDALADEDFDKTLEVSARSLTEYVLYRDFIVKKLSVCTADDREDVIHNLIVPKYETLHGKGLTDAVYRNNAWLLDDRFMTYRTLLSARAH